MYGRGGAGNINAAKDATSKTNEDIEAHRNRSTTVAIGQEAPSSQPSTAAQLQDYAHMGRGGAGNWYRPTELAKDGTFSQSSNPTATPINTTPQISTPWHPEGQEMPVARGGRGGAGNFLWKSEEQKQKQREEVERKKDALKQGVERDVEAGLAKPPGAVLGKEGHVGW